MNGLFLLPSITQPDYAARALEIFLLQEERLRRIPDDMLNQSCIYGVDNALLSTEWNGMCQDAMRVPSSEPSEEAVKTNRYWTDEENLAFEKVVSYYGYTSARGINNALVAEFVGTRTAGQVRSHAQKYFMKKVCLSNNQYLTSRTVIQLLSQKQTRSV